MNGQVTYKQDKKRKYNNNNKNRSPTATVEKVSSQHLQQEHVSMCGVGEGAVPSAVEHPVTTTTTLIHHQRHHKRLIHVTLIVASQVTEMWQHCNPGERIGGVLHWVVGQGRVGAIPGSWVVSLHW